MKAGGKHVIFSIANLTQTTLGYARNAGIKQRNEMKKLSTGVDSTLAEYRDLSLIFFGKEGKAVAFLDEKIEKEGANQEVLTDEAQMIQLLHQINKGLSHDQGNKTN